MLKRAYNPNASANNTLQLTKQDTAAEPLAAIKRYQVVANVDDVINIIISVDGVAQTLTFSAVNTSATVEAALKAALETAGYIENPADNLPAVQVTDDGTDFTINIHARADEFSVTSINIGASDEAPTVGTVQISKNTIVLDTPGGTGIVITLDGVDYAIGDFTHGSEAVALLQTELEDDLDTAPNLFSATAVDNAGADGYLVTLVVVGGTVAYWYDAVGGRQFFDTTAVVADFSDGSVVYADPNP